MLAFEQALVSEAAILSDLAFTSKSYWPYSPDQLQRWASDLRVTPSGIERWPTVTARLGGALAGFYQLRRQADGAVRLEHFWLLPAFIGRGLGRSMLTDAVERARTLRASSLLIESDPHAEAFYLACGAVQVGEIPAPIEGAQARKLPILKISLESAREPARRMHDRL
jgi:GNAT superfamily N-acetyltransferase